MAIEKDFKELLKLFNKNSVRYCIVGAFAVGFYAKPRYTKDMDILVEPNIENAQNIIKALSEFGFEFLKLSIKDFCQKNRIVQLGYEPIRIDLLTSIQGSNFAKIWKNKVLGEYGSEKVYFIGLDELIKNKKISKRKQDLADLDILLFMKNKKRK